MNDQDRYDFEVSREQWDAEEEALEFLNDPVARIEYELFLDYVESKDGKE